MRWYVNRGRFTDMGNNLSFFYSWISSPSPSLLCTISVVLMFWSITIIQVFEVNQEAGLLLLQSKFSEVLVICEIFGDAADVIIINQLQCINLFTFEQYLLLLPY